MKKMKRTEMIEMNKKEKWIGMVIVAADILALIWICHEVYYNVIIWL